MMKFWSGLILAFIFPLAAHTSICLNMIVKDEEAVIESCLNSVKPHIDFWVIVDTGSCDQTKDIIRKTLKDIPGELYDAKWYNFAWNRNEAMKYAQGKADYLLFIDADEILELNHPLALQQLECDIYSAMVKTKEMIGRRILLVRSNLEAFWQGNIHETVYCNTSHTQEHLDKVWLNAISEEGARSQQENKYAIDAKHIEGLLHNDPQNSRLQFYLATSWESAKNHDKAYIAYSKRSRMKGPFEETFFALYRMAAMLEIMKCDDTLVTTKYLDSYAFDMNRYEPLYHVARLKQECGDILTSYVLCRKAMLLKSRGFGSMTMRTLYESDVENLWQTLCQFTHEQP